MNAVSLSLLLALSRSMLVLVLHFCSTREWLFKEKEFSMGLLKLLFNMSLTRRLRQLRHSLDLKQESRLCDQDVIKEITLVHAH